MSKLLANTLVILGARVRDAQEGVKTEKYYKEAAEGREKTLRLEIAAKDMEIRSLRKSLDERERQNKSLAFDIAYAVQELQKKKKPSVLDLRALNTLKKCV